MSQSGDPQQSSSYMSGDNLCTTCNGVLPGDCPRGLCPRCALQGALVLTQPEPNPSALPAVQRRPAQDNHSKSSHLIRLNRIGDYELLEQLGRGGMGVVYRARQKSLGRQVAVKMLLNSALSSPAMVRRFEMEAETVARLDHPNIVSIYEVGEEDGLHYFSMKLVDGESLAQQIAQRKFALVPGGKDSRTSDPRLLQQRIARLTATVLHAVHYAHNQGVLHRDIKPGNILMDRGGQPHLTDFGLAKVEAIGTLTGSGAVLGTPSYMAPEVADGRGSTAASDVYSVGIVLYELLTGRTPFQGQTPVELLRRIVDDDAPHPRKVNLQVDRDLAVICLKALEKDSDRRYRSAVEMAADLERWLRNEPVLARRPGPLLRTHRWMKRNPAGAALMAVLCAGLFACLVLLLVVWEQKREFGTALNLLVKSIGQRVQGFPNPERAYEEFKSEELKILLGHSGPQGTLALLESGVLGLFGRNREAGDPPIDRARRFTVAIFIDQTAMQSLVSGGKIISRVEEHMRATLALPVHLDLRIYNNLGALKDDLVRGEIHFAAIDGRTCLAAQMESPVVVALACDQRPGLRCVVFASQTSEVRQMMDLKGRKLAIRSVYLFPTTFVFAELAKAGLCAGDVHCPPSNIDSMKGKPRRPNTKKGEGAYFGDKDGPRIQEVLDSETWAAGVAMEARLDAAHEGIRWRRLATFYIPDFLWVAGPKANDHPARDAFVQALQRLTDPRELDFMLLDTETDGFAFTTNTHAYLEAFRAAELGKARFENCGTNLASAGISPSR